MEDIVPSGGRPYHLIYFLIRTLRVSSPLLNLRVFKIPRFTYSLIVNSIITISLYAGTLLTPLYMQEIKHASAFHTGLVMLPGTLTMAIVSFMVGKVYDKVGPFRLLVVGIVIMAISTWSLSLIHVSTATSYIMIWLAVRYVGIAFSYMPITNAGMTAVPQQFSGHASAVTNWIRQGTAAFSISIFSTMLTSRTVAHVKELGPATQGGSEQGLSMAIQDLFVIGTILVVLALPVTFLLLKKQKPIQESALVPTASA